ncbi:MAG: type II secretion system F family protein [Candidatus Nanoarchaeia archaeon]
MQLNLYKFLQFDVKKLDKKLLIPIFGAPILTLFAAVLILVNASSTTILATIAIGVILLASPYFALEFLEFRRIRLAEDTYPNFLRDLAQAVNSGMTIPQAIATIAETEYGTLSNYIKRLHSWLAWNIPFPEAWSNFTSLLKKSEMITRINGIIIESFLAGGDIGAVLSSLAEDVDIIKKMEADKRTTMQQHLIVMYVVFFVFLGIIVILHQILLPILYLQRFSVFAGVSFRPAELLTVDYFKNLFFLMTVIQAASLGAIAGQITEEKLIAGFKHTVVMLAIGIIVFLLLILPSKLTFETEVTPQSVGLGQPITVSGRVFFDAQPAGGAKIEIIGPSGELMTLFADSLGAFSTIIIAPTQPGQYQISILMSYGSEVRTETKAIIVT